MGVCGVLPADASMPLAAADECRAIIPGLSAWT
jgi:hypothetical protein